MEKGITAMEIMELCRGRKDDIAALEDRIDSLREGMTRITAGMGQDGRAAMGDKYAAYVARLDDLERRLRLTKKLYGAEQVAVILLTDRFPAARRDCLRLYYGRGHSPQQIGIHIGYSQRHVERILEESREALDGISPRIVASILPNWYLKNRED